MFKIAERIPAYRYAIVLRQHLRTQLGGKKFVPFNGELVLPRQVEFHLGGHRGNACNLRCEHCQGQSLAHVVAPIGSNIFRLVENLRGSIPLFVLSGNYSEPTMFGGLIDLIELIKQTGAAFGLHSNGILLSHLERKEGFLTRMQSASTSDDYLTVSLDAGRHRSYTKTKGVGKNAFISILKALEILKRLKMESLHEGLKVRATYLLNDHNSSEKELNTAVASMNSLGVASLRFSIPYAPFGVTWDVCMEYHKMFERPLFDKVKPVVKQIMADAAENPDSMRIVMIPPESQDVTRMTYHHCFHGYYQVTLGTDGIFYRCSAAANPDFFDLRLGPLTTDIDKFHRMLLKNQCGTFNPQHSCFESNARCNRAAVEVNSAFERAFFSPEISPKPHR